MNTIWWCDADVFQVLVDTFSVVNFTHVAESSTWNWQYWICPLANILGHHAMQRGPQNKSKLVGGCLDGRVGLLCIPRSLIHATSLVSQARPNQPSTDHFQYQLVPDLQFYKLLHTNSLEHQLKWICCKNYNLVVQFWMTSFSIQFGMILVVLFCGYEYLHAQSQL